MKDSILQHIPDNIITDRMTYGRGEVIYSLATAGSYVYILASGRAICQMDSADGGFMPICVYEAYCLFGEIEIFTDWDQSACIEAITDCTAIRIDRSNFMKWIAQDPDFSVFLMTEMSRKLLNQTQKTRDLITLSVKERVLAVVESYDRDRCLDLMTKQKLSCAVSAPIRSVNRAIASLVNEGVLSYKDRQFQLLSSRQKCHSI